LKVPKRRINCQVNAIQSNNAPAATRQSGGWVKTVETVCPSADPTVNSEARVNPFWHAWAMTVGKTLWLRSATQLQKRLVGNTLTLCTGSKWNIAKAMLVRRIATAGE
jgi:hypothetical protein